MEYGKDMYIVGRSLACKQISANKRNEWMQLEMMEIQLQVYKPSVKKKLSDALVVLTLKLKRRTVFHYYDPANIYGAQPIASCKWMLVHTALYIKALELVFLLQDCPRWLTRMYLPTKKCSVVNPKVKASTMKLHLRDQRIYLIIDTRARKIPVRTMTTNGKFLPQRFVVTGYKPASSMALDENKDLIYVTNYVFIISFTTQGKDIRAVFKRGGASSVCLNPTGTLLYFSQGQDIFQLDMMTNISKKLNGCPRQHSLIHSMQWFLNTVLVTGLEVDSFSTIEHGVCHLHKVNASSIDNVILVPPI